MNPIDLIFWLLLCLTLTLPTSPCKVAPDYQFATDEEEITLASTVVFGRVGQVDYIIPSNVAVITLDSYQVWKSWHLPTSRKPRKLQISGFRSSASCGSGIPKVGDSVVLFLCPNWDRKTWLNAKGRAWKKRYWKLNDIAVFSGMKYLEGRELRKFQTLAKRLGRRTRGPKCGGRLDSGPFRFPLSLKGPDILDDDDFYTAVDPDDE